jgi:mono/diheme cytochrome c family protein
MVAHSTMPVFKLRPEEVGDVLNYISSLQKPAPGK